MTIIIRGDPRTKKNSQRLVHLGGRVIPVTSKAYEQYRRDCLNQITGDKRKRIDFPVNVQCVYFMKTHRKVDLVNLLEATCDILVDAGVLEDDNSTIITGHNGSAVHYDKDDPRVEITISSWSPRLCGDCKNFRVTGERTAENNGMRPGTCAILNQDVFRTSWCQKPQEIIWHEKAMTAWDCRHGKTDKTEIREEFEE